MTPSIVSEKASLAVAFSDDVKYKISLLLPQAALDFIHQIRSLR